MVPRELARTRRLIAYVGHFSEKNDKRLLHILGEDNQDLYEEYDPKLLAKRFNYRIEPTSSPPISKCRVKPAELDPGIGRGESPLDLVASLVAFFFPRRHMPLQVLLGLDPLGQALPG